MSWFTRVAKMICYALWHTLTILFKKESLVKKEMKKRVLVVEVNLKVLRNSPAPPLSECPDGVLLRLLLKRSRHKVSEGPALITPPMDRVDRSAPATLPRFDPTSPLLPPGSS